MTRPQIITDARELRRWADAAIAADEGIALVPTMGYLHQGHLRLVDEARARAPRVVVSIFVNPEQFRPGEDLERYPRDFEADVHELTERGVDVVFAPGPDAVYPPGFDTYVAPARMDTVLCGASRPGHFRGVCTVVALLFRISRCQIAVFGEKDYQQLQIIRRMAKDLWLDVDIVGVPTERDADGLALSSRNAYLSDDERRQALVLIETLRGVAARAAAGERDVSTLLAWGREQLESGASMDSIDYIDIVSADDLEPVTTLAPGQRARAAVAAYVGQTRLIDNVEVVAAS